MMYYGVLITDFWSAWEQFLALGTLPVLSIVNKLQAVQHGAQLKAICHPRNLQAFV